MPNQAWLGAVRRVLDDTIPEPLGIATLIGVENFSFDVLTFGYSLGLISANDAVAIELERLNLAITLSDAEEEIALALSDELDRVEDRLRVGSGESCENSHAKELWLYAIVGQMRREWPEIGSIFPQFQFGELDSAWGGDNFLKSFLVKSPLNKWYFGKRAYRQFVRILDQELRAERARLGLSGVAGDNAE